MRVVSEITEIERLLINGLGVRRFARPHGRRRAAQGAGRRYCDGPDQEGNRFAVLTDILGDEDHLGDMDFKVAGTDRGVTALQMDIKIRASPKSWVSRLRKRNEARRHILGIMHEAMPHNRTEMSACAPRVVTFKINPENPRRDRQGRRRHPRAVGRNPLPDRHSGRWHDYHRFAERR